MREARSLLADTYRDTCLVRSCLFPLARGCWLAMKASALVEGHDSTVINHFSGPSLVPFLYSVLAVLQIRFVRLRVRHDSLVRSVCACLCDGERERKKQRGGWAKGGRVPGCAQCSSGPLPDVSAMPLHIGLALTVTDPQSRHTEICHPA